MRIRWLQDWKRLMRSQADVPHLSRYLEHLRSLNLFCLGALALICGCVSQQQYRTGYDPITYPSTLTNAAQADIEIATNYTLGYVEFDDQGWLFDHRQIDKITNEFSGEMKTNGLLMVVYVHGWKHNASSDDDNVVMFHKRILARLADNENSQTNEQLRRRIVGVYVGWRGLSDDVPLLNDASFWNRKNTAERVGHGSVVELLSQLEDLRNQGNDEYSDAIHAHQRAGTKLLILGHSFGGDIVYSATAPILTERMVQYHQGRGTNAAPPKGLGDLIVLINPAFEAARFETIHSLSTTNQSITASNCTLAVFTSTHDEATGLAFPAGRTLTTLFRTYENREQRRSDITAIGHYQPYISYNLKVTSPNADLRRSKNTETENTAAESARTIKLLKEKLHENASKRHTSTNDVVFAFSQCELSPTTNCAPASPIFNVAVDPKMIP